MGKEITPSDLDFDLDFSSETTRKMFARRLAPEITGQPFVEDPERTRAQTLDRSAAVRRLEKIFQAMHESENSAGTRKRRGLIENQRRYEAVTGRSLEEDLEKAYEEYNEYDIEKVAKWVSRSPSEDARGSVRRFVR